MGKQRISIERVAEICGRLIRGETVQSIRLGMSTGEMTIQRVRKVLERFGFEIDHRTIPRLAPEAKARIRELFATTSVSNGEIARLVGCCANTVDKARRAYHAELTARGEPLPLCGCGRDLSHPGDCQVRADAKAARRGVDLGARANNRELARPLLIAGQSYLKIGHRLGISWCIVRGFCHQLAQEDRDERTRNRATAAGRKRASELNCTITRPHSTDPRADPVYRRALSAIPAGAPSSLRDEAASDTYLEYLEGRCPLAEIEKTAKRMLARNYDAFANRWGALSLDIPMDGESGATWAERVEDPRALAAFDAIGDP